MRFDQAGNLAWIQSTHVLLHLSCLPGSGPCLILERLELELRLELQQQMGVGTWQRAQKHLCAEIVAMRKA